MIAYERHIFVLHVVLNTINKLCANVRHVIVKVRVTVVECDPGRLNHVTEFIAWKPTSNICNAQQIV